MTTNAHDKIIDAVLAALLAAPSLASGNVLEEATFDTLPEGMDTAIVVTLVDSQPVRGAMLGHPVYWRSTVQLDCLARADRNTAGARASRALHAQAYARLMVDRTLGGQADNLDEPALTADAELMGDRLACLIARYPIDHHTQALSLEV